MIWLRKGVVHLLSLILLLSLLGAALSTSANSAFSHPAKIETWLSQSNVYSHFVGYVTDQAQKSTGGNASSVALTDVVVQQAANSSFAPQTLQQDVNTFLNSNYSWLESKTSTPSFTIDFTTEKQNFAQTVGKYVTTYLAGLPVCTNAQLAQLAAATNNDPLSLSCRPASLGAQTEGQQITQQLSSSSSFLSNPVITANNINPTHSHQSDQPYYQKLSKAPQLYRAAIHLPLASAVLAILSAVGIFFIAPRRRRGLRRIGEVFLVAGVLLVALKFGADKAFKHFESRIFNSSSVGQLQQSLTDFAHRLESQLVKVDLWFGIAFLIVAIICFGTLFATKQRGPKALRPEKLAPLPDAAVAATPAAPPTPRSKPPRLVQ